MKRERDPNKPRRKFKATSKRSPGELLRSKQRKRLFAIDPEAGSILEQARNAVVRTK